MTFGARRTDFRTIAPSLAGGALAGALSAAAIMFADGAVRLGLIAGVVAILTACWIAIGPLYWWTSFVAAALLLPPLPFPLGNSGPHVALVFAALGVWVALARLWEWKFEPDAVAILLFTFTAWLVATALFAALYSGASAAAGSLARVGLFGIGVFAYFYTADGPGRVAGTDAFRWARWAFLLASVSAAFAVVDFYFQWPPLSGFAAQFVWLPFGVYRRAQGVFYEAGMLGNLCSMFLLMAVVAAVRPQVRRKIVSEPVLLLGGTALMAALVLSFSRSSLMHLAAALAALLALERRRIFAWRRMIFALLVLLLAGLLIALSAPEVLLAYARRLGDMLFYAGASPEALLSGRLETWSLLASKLADQPWVLLTGIGFKTLPYTSYFGEPLVADNMYLSLLAETGVVGLFLMGALSLAMLAAAMEARRRESPAGWFCGTWFFCFWIGQLAQMLSVDVLTYWRVLPLAFFTLALARLEGSRAKNSSTT